MFDDDPPAKKPAQTANLEPMSVDELRAYIAALEGEIERARAEIAKKEAYKNAADSFFKN